MKTLLLCTLRCYFLGLFKLQIPIFLEPTSLTTAFWPSHSCWKFQPWFNRFCRQGLGPRLTGSLAYILPLTEAFKFMLPLVQQFPPLGVIFGPITLLTVLLNTIPFIPLILFVTFIIFAQVKESRHFLVIREMLSLHGNWGYSKLTTAYQMLVVNSRISPDVNLPSHAKDIPRLVRFNLEQDLLRHKMFKNWTSSSEHCFVWHSGISGISDSYPVVPWSA